MLTLENLHIGDVVEYNLAEGGEAEDWVDCTIDLQDLLWLSKCPKIFNMFHRRKESLGIEKLLRKLVLVSHDMTMRSKMDWEFFIKEGWSADCILDYNKRLMRQHRGFVNRVKKKLNLTHKPILNKNKGAITMPEVDEINSIIEGLAVK